MAVTGASSGSGPTVSLPALDWLVNVTLATTAVASVGMPLEPPTTVKVWWTPLANLAGVPPGWPKPVRESKTRLGARLK